MVGVAGFEPTTSPTPWVRATNYATLRSIASKPVRNEDFANREVGVEDSETIITQL